MTPYAKLLLNKSKQSRFLPELLDLTPLMKAFGAIYRKIRLYLTQYSLVDRTKLWLRDLATRRDHEIDKDEWLATRNRLWKRRSFLQPLKALVMALSGGGLCPGWSLSGIHDWDTWQELRLPKKRAEFKTACRWEVKFVSRHNDCLDRVEAKSTKTPTVCSSTLRSQDSTSWPRCMLNLTT